MRIYTQYNNYEELGEYKSVMITMEPDIYNKDIIISFGYISKDLTKDEVENYLFLTKNRHNDIRKILKKNIDKNTNGEYIVITSKLRDFIKQFKESSLNYSNDFNLSVLDSIYEEEDNKNIINIILKFESIFTLSSNNRDIAKLLLLIFSDMISDNKKGKYIKLTKQDKDRILI